MSLKRFNNTDSLTIPAEGNYGYVYSDKILNVAANRYEYTLLSPNNSELNLNMEFHVMSPDNSGRISYSLYQINKDIYTELLGNDIIFDIKEAFDLLGIERGTYSYLINYQKNLIGSPEVNSLVVKEISPDRTEVSVRINTNISSSILDSTIRNIQDFYTRKGSGQLKKENPLVVGTYSYLDPNNYTIVSGTDYNGTLGEYIDSFVLNFGNNNIYKIINTYADDINSGIVDVNPDTVIYFKLDRPLENNIEILDTVWVADELIDPYIDYVKFIPRIFEPVYNTLRGPNFDIDIPNNRSRETDFKTWTQLLNTVDNVKRDIVNSLFSGSVQGIDLNIDYSGFDNFVFYGSAKERIDTFYYKLQQIEYYDAQILSLQNASGSLVTGRANNIEINNRRKYEVIGTFDDFEKWLYYEPTSSYFTHGVSGSFIGAQGYTITPFPKFFNNGTYILHHSTSSLGSTWYSGLIATGSLYDEQNSNALVNTIPQHIREDSLNNKYVLFVNMIGHYYDIIWSYVDAMNKRYSTEQHPRLGIPKAILPTIANSFGWELINGKESKDLWKYKLGTSSSGSYQSTGSIFTKSFENDTTEIWRRIVNNIPYIYKTKGTARSVDALLNTYGIPKTLVPIKEFGGPAISSIDAALIDDRFNYALRISGSYVRTNWSYVFPAGSNNPADVVPPRTIMFRFKPAVTGSMSLIAHTRIATRVGWNLILEHTGSYSGSANYGRLTYKLITGSNFVSSGSSEYLPIFDGDWWNVMISTDTPMTSSASEYVANVTINVGKASDSIVGRVIHTSSFAVPTTIDTEWTSSNLWCSRPVDKDFEHIRIGGVLGTNGATAPDTYNGYIQSYKEYRERISEDIFNYHILNPAAYRANNPTGSYDTLIKYYPFGVDGIRYNYSGTVYISSSHPNYNVKDFGIDSSSNTYATSSGFEASPPDGYHYVDNVETFYTYTPDTFGSNVRSQKIRLESSDLIGTLNPEYRVERSQFDRSPVDSNKLVIAFSPQDQLNKDIYNHIGYVNLDDYFGLPEFQFETEYTKLHTFANEYWKKFDNRNDLNAYIRVFSLFDFSFFESLKQLVPARANLISGLLIEPSILERSKVISHKRPSYTRNDYNINLSLELDSNVTGSYTDYSTTISTLGDRYAASTYKYISILFSGSTGTAITSSTPDIIASPTGSYIDSYRVSSIYKKTIFHYSSSAAWATTPFLVGYDIAVSQSMNKYYSKSLADSSYRDDDYTGISRLYYNGCKLTGPGINVPTTSTPDNGPVVEVIDVGSTELAVSDRADNSSLSIL